MRARHKRTICDIIFRKNEKQLPLASQIWITATTPTQRSRFFWKKRIGRISIAAPLAGKFRAAGFQYLLQRLDANRHLREALRAVCRGRLLGSPRGS
jgi:hypothetical protein